MGRKTNRTKSVKQVLKHFNKQRDQAIKLEINTLTDRYVIRSNHSHYMLLDKIAHLGNNLFNLATYHYRQNIFKKRWLNYGQLNKMFKQMRDQHSNMLYAQMPTVQFAQQILKQVQGNFATFGKTIKAYRRKPQDFSGRPRLPHYHKKGTRAMITVSNQNARVKGHYLKIASLNNLIVKLRRPIEKIQQVRIIPKADIFILEVVYNTSELIRFKSDNHRYLSIDPGIDNAFTLASNVPGLRPVIFNGRPLKSINHRWNQQSSRLKRLHAKYKQSIMSHNLRRLNRFRYLKMERFAHEASNAIIQYAISHELNTIIIGNNKGWKRSSNMGKRNNQNFIGIPHQKFIEKIQYKGVQYGIAVVKVPEGYTSQTSFLDQERPCWENGNKSRKRNHLVPNNRRVYRGLFKSNDGTLINADVNGSLQILKKAVPNAFVDGIQGIGLCPIKYNLNF